MRERVREPPLASRRAFRALRPSLPLVFDNPTRRSGRASRGAARRNGSARRPQGDTQHVFLAGLARRAKKRHGERGELGVMNTPSGSVDTARQGERQLVRVPGVVPQARALSCACHAARQPSQNPRATLPTCRWLVGCRSVECGPKCRRAHRATSQRRHGLARRALEWTLHRDLTERERC